MSPNKKQIYFVYKNYLVWYFKNYSGELMNFVVNSKKIRCQFHDSKILSRLVHACSVMSDSFRSHGLKPTRIFSSWDSPEKILEWVAISSRKNTGVGCHFLLQGNLPNPGTKSTSLASPVLAGRWFTVEPLEKPCI